MALGFHMKHKKHTHRKTKMLKLSTTIALAALISISALSTAEASKGSYEESFVQESNSIQYRTNRSGLVRSPVMRAFQTNLGEDEQPANAQCGSNIIDEEAEETHPTGMLNTVMNFISSFFWRS